MPTNKSQNTKRKPMSRKTFWINIAAMALVVLVVLFLTFRWLDKYTQHGQFVVVPDVTQLQEEDAISVLKQNNLVGVSADRSFVKGIPEGQVVQQRPAGDAKVKAGRTIYLTLSSGTQPLVMVPDVADNSSLRQASSQLRAAGFKLTANDTIRGEADWVYKVLYDGREVTPGEKIPEGSTLTLVIGNGNHADTESLIPADVEEDWF